MDPKKADSVPQPDEGPARPSRLSRLRLFFKEGIWNHDLNRESTINDRWIATLRILFISWKGLLENRLFSRAAALSYSSLIALGPLVAIIVILSSSFIHTNAETQIKRALLFINPSLQEMINLEDSATNTEMQSTLDTLITQIVDGAESLLSQVNTSGSKTFGAMGALILIWVVIQLLTSVETTLNQIWGVHQGRPWTQRIVFYWAFVSLGGLLGLGSTALFSASNLAAMTDWVPFGSEMTSLILEFSPVLSYAMLVLLLTLFYRFFPNTSVTFRAALIGSLMTATLLILNNYLSILYVHRVISFQSLYGSVGIVPVLMIGLYLFWVLILLGGQLTYAVQNADYLSNQTAWKQFSPAGRELVTMSTFLHIARRFHGCEKAPSINEISKVLTIPVNIVNEALDILEDMDWVTAISMTGVNEEVKMTGYRPSRPLQAYSLSRFKTAFEHFGNSGICEQLVDSDRLVRDYQEALRWHESDAFCQSDLESLLSGKA